VVREFLDVFLDELPGMPPKRAIEFKTELLPGTARIAKASYKMSSVELADLKIELQDLLDKGFIRPSSSHWRCPALFIPKKDKECRLCVDYHLRWFGHIQWRPTEAPVRSRVIRRSGNKKRGRGRPNLTCEESVKRDLKDWCITKELALDRREWKLAIHVPEP
jgi:hypothetical protein